MTLLASDVMQGFLSHLQQAIGPQKYAVWFADATKISFTDAAVEVGVPNLFISDYLQAHFTQAIEDAARNATGRGLKAVFRIHPDLFQKRRKETLSAEAEFLQEQSPQQSHSAPDASSGVAADKQSAATAAASNGYRVFTLDNFVVGDCNRVAYAAARSAVANPGREFNPLFIHGDSGLGKTHLLQGIINGLRASQPSLKCEYISAEAFTNQYIMSMKTGSLDGFRHRHRNLDVLVIDDIHFLGGKTATQEEFLHTFNAFDTAGKLVVLASDAHPRQIGRIRQQLVSRWVSGMVARLSTPQRPTREAILRKKAALMGRSVSKAVLALMAERVTGSIRELEGALIKLLAYAALDHRPINIALAEKVLADLHLPQPTAIRIQDIEDVVCKFFGINPSDIKSCRKGRQISLARHLIMYLARKLTPLSFPEIGQLLGGKNHSTVIAAYRKIEKMAEAGQPLRWFDAKGQQEMSLEDLLTALSDQLQP